MVLVLRRNLIVARLLPLAMAFGAAATAAATPQAATGGEVAHDCCRETSARRSGNALPQDRKSRLLREIAERLAASEAPFFGEQALRRVEQDVNSMPSATPPMDEIKLRAKHGDLLAQYGHYDAAIEAYQKALALAERTGDGRAAQRLLKDLGIASMRLGERRNCIARHNQDSCLFPLKEGAIHLDRSGSEQAIGWFTELLGRAPKDAGAMWLLNIASMTLGTYPQAVPEQWRIPPEKLKSEHALPRMFDCAKAKGFTGANRAGGSILDDFDGDGRIDLAVSSMDTFTPLRLWLQRAKGLFEEVTDRAGLAGQLGGLQLFHLDANNDGRLDLLVQRGGWMGPAGEIPNSLLIQQEDGTFVDRTLDAGIEIAAPSQAAAIADVDLDGDLDLFLGYEGAGTRYPSRLFLNRGDGVFSDATQRFGIRACGFVIMKRYMLKMISCLEYYEYHVVFKILFYCRKVYI